MKRLVEVNPWQELRRFTPARIALGRAGVSLPTAALLDFGLAHAQARDAVGVTLDLPAILSALSTAGYASVPVHSAAADRHHYLRRPDLGRRLNAASRARLQAWAATATRPQLLFVIADGLSAAAARHALPLLRAVQPQLTGWAIGPLVVAEQARVALGDEIGDLLGVEALAVLIGERPGLSSPESLGVYVTYAPRVGRTDAERNCISNVRPEGLSFEQAAQRLTLLLDGARRLGRSGIALKVESGPAQLSIPSRSS